LKWWISEMGRSGGDDRVRKKAPAEDTGAVRKDDRVNWGTLIVPAAKVIVDTLQRIDPDQRFEIIRPW
jgi:hypothetical protein